MKKFVFVAVLAALFTGGAAVQAKENVSAVAVKSLVGVAAPEIPAAVVKAMQQSPKGDRASMVSALVRSVAKTHPAALRSVIIAVAKADPSMAAVATSVAARLFPAQVSDFVVAACSVAPKESAQIIAVASKVTVTSSAVLAERVAAEVSSVNATVLSRQASEVRVSMTAGDAAQGGFIFFPTPSGGIIGYTIDGDEVIGDPQGATGFSGFDGDRYAEAGS